MMYMKERIGLFLVGMLMVSAIYALPVGLGKAASKAVNMLGKGVVATFDVTAQARARLEKKSGYPAFYVFNAEDGEGFVIISGDDEMPEVVAYSYTGHFDAAKMHPGLVDMLDYYTEVVNEVRAGEATVEKAASPVVTANAVKPLCATQWGQEEPYNTLCPKKDGTVCPVGCVATAMAQIMYHFAWPKVGTGSFRYASGITGVGVLSSNFSEHHYAWETMGKTTEENLASIDASKAVAQLSYDCGIATRMEYDPEGSGTNDDKAMEALYTYFSYKASMLDIKRRACYATQEEWNALVRAELDANRPVLYAGFSKTDGGHEFIIDGYDAKGNFHVNWGWDGNADAYYSIITLNPARTSYSFSNDQSMVCGIEPDETGEDKTPQQWRIYMYEPSTVDVESVELGKAFMVNIGRFYNYSRTAHTWTRGVALYDLNGNQLRLLSSKKNSNYTDQYLSYHGPRLPLSVSATIPEDISDGEYVLRAVFRQKEYKDFVLPDMEGGSELNQIFVSIKDGVATFIPISVSIYNICVEKNSKMDNATVIAHQYFGVNGLPVKELTKGVFFDRQVLSNGKQIVRKLLVR